MRRGFVRTPLACNTWYESNPRFLVRFGTDEFLAEAARLNVMAFARNAVIAPSRDYSACGLPQILCMECRLARLFKPENHQR